MSFRSWNWGHIWVYLLNIHPQRSPFENFLIARRVHLRPISDGALLLSQTTPLPPT